MTGDQRLTTLIEGENLFKSFTKILGNLWIEDDFVSLYICNVLSKQEYLTSWKVNVTSTTCNSTCSNGIIFITLSFFCIIMQECIVAWLKFWARPVFHFCILINWRKHNNKCNKGKFIEEDHYSLYLYYFLCWYTFLSFKYL